MTKIESILDIASRHLPAAGVDCLLIGAFAVNHYGYTRTTLDIDFMIVSEQMETVRGILREAGFTNMDMRENVAFFSAPDAGPRVDFLRVDGATMRMIGRRHPEIR